MFDVYVYLKNEVSLLPDFLQYYGGQRSCRRIVALDNSSDDGSLQILMSHPKVEIRAFVSSGDSYVHDIQRWQNEVWRESTGFVQYALLVTVDEWIGPDLEAKLTSHSANGVTVLRPQGYDMVSEVFESPFQTVRGVPSPGYSKPCIVDPNAISSLHFNPGTHDGTFEGRVRLECPQELKLYHFRYLGREQTWTRYRALRSMLREGDVSRGYGWQYGMTRAEFDKHFDALMMQSVELEPLCPPP